MLSREEWQWLRDNLWVPPAEVKTIAKPVFMSLKKQGECSHITGDLRVTSNFLLVGVCTGIYVVIHNITQNIYMHGNY